MLVYLLPIVWVVFCVVAREHGFQRLTEGLRAAVADQFYVLVVATVLVAVSAQEPRFGSWWGWPVFAVSYAVYLLAVMDIARRMRFLWLWALGAACNFAVMMLSNGMPVNGWYAGQRETVLHHAASSADRVRWLGDVIHVPGTLVGGWYSIGDVLVFVGAALVVWHLCSTERVGEGTALVRSS